MRGDARAFSIQRRLLQGGRLTSFVRATLVLRAESVAPSGVTTLSAVLTGVDAEDEALSGLATAPQPFVVKMGSDCRFEGFGFAPATPPRTARALRALMRTYEVVVPTGAAARTWTVAQRDDDVVVRLRYALNTADGGVGLTRRQEHIAMRGRVQGLNPRVTASDARWSLAPDLRWLDTLTGDDAFRMAPGAGAAGEMRSVYALARVPGAWPDVALPPGWPDGVDFSEPVGTVDANRLAADDPARRLDLRGAVARLRALYDARRNAAADEAVTFLVSWLESHPEAAAALLREMRAGTYPRDLSAVTFFSMSKARDPRVRDAMIGAVRDEGMPLGDRFRASVALGDSVTADRATVDALRRVYDGRRPGDSLSQEGLTDSALYAVGTIASRTRGDVAEAAHGVLRAVLDAARDPEARVDALTAAANSHDRRYRRDAEEALGDSSDRVRGAAAHTLGAIRDAEGEAALRARLQTEQVPAVLQEVIGALRLIVRRPSPDTVRVAGMRLVNVDDVATRVALVDLIGAVADSNAEARQTLRAWFSQERDVRVQSAIGRYVRAAELGGA